MNTQLTSLVRPSSLRLTLCLSGLLLFTQVNQVTAGVVTSLGLVGHWHADGDALDSSTSTNDATLNGSATFDTGQVGQAFSFDGTSDATAATAGLPSGSGDRTIAFWVNGSNMAVGNTMLFGWGNLAGQEMSSIVLGLGNAPSRKVGFWGWSADFESVSTLSDDTWYHVAFTLSGTSGDIYINGALDNSATLPVLNTPTGTNLFFGNFSGIMGNFDGLLDEVTVYDRALSATEIQTLATVPEPATLSMLLLGFGGIMIRRRTHVSR